MPPRMRRVALLLDFHDCYDIEVARGVLRFAKEKGNWRLFSRSWLFNPLEDANDWNGDGIIARVHENFSLEREFSWNLPIVDVAGTAINPEYAQVANDDILAGYQAGRHLQDGGWKAAAFIGVRQAGWSTLRRIGFEMAVAETGTREMATFETDTRWNWNKRKFSQLMAWLKKLPKPCGVLVADPPLAAKAIQAMNEGGIAVPKEIAVVTIGNEDMMCELSEPSITSIPCDCPRIGYEAAAALDRHMDGGGNDSPPIRIMPCPLLQRESSDASVRTDSALAGSVAFIRAHAHTGINVADVVRHAAVCRRSLEKKFRSELGCSIHREIIRIRMELAAKHLDSGFNASETAARIGFATTQHFHTVFIRHYHMTPMEYARRKRATSDARSLL